MTNKEVVIKNTKTDIKEGVIRSIKKAIENIEEEVIGILRSTTMKVIITREYTFEVIKIQLLILSMVEIGYWDFL